MAVIITEVRNVDAVVTTMITKRPAVVIITMTMAMKKPVVVIIMTTAITTTAIITIMRMRYSQAGAGRRLISIQMRNWISC